MYLSRFLFVSSGPVKTSQRPPWLPKLILAERPRTSGVKLIDLTLGCWNFTLRDEDAFLLSEVSYSCYFASKRRSPSFKSNAFCPMMMQAPHKHKADSSLHADPLRDTARFASMFY